MQMEPRYRDLEIVDKSVFRAFDTKTKRLVALKAQDPALNPRARILREAQAYEVLQRGEARAPGLVGCLGFDPEQGALVLEWLDGVTFATLIQRRPYPESLLISWAVSICKTLKFMHKNGVIHRDLAPKNVMLLTGTKAEVRLLDLGLALVASPMGGYEPFAPGRVGTIPYRAPEVSDAFPGDARSDIYSLGRLLADFARPRGEPSTKAPSEGLRRIIAKASAQKPGERYSSAEEMLEALRRLGLVGKIRRTLSSTPFQLGAVVVGSLGGLWGFFGNAGSLDAHVPVNSSVTSPPHHTAPVPSPAPVVLLNSRSVVPAPAPVPEPVLVTERRPSPNKAKKTALPSAPPSEPSLSLPPTSPHAAPSSPLEDVASAVEELKLLASQPKTIVTPPERIILTVDAKNE
jgi:serine/threonine protein kinase